MGRVKRSLVARSWKWGGMNRQSTEDQQGTEKTHQYDTILMHTHHYTFVQTHRMYNTKGNPNENNGLGVLLICQCRFIHCNKFTTLVGDVGNGGGYTCVGERGCQKIFTSTAQSLFVSKVLLNHRHQPKDWSWHIELKLPAARLGRKENMSILPEFCKNFFMTQVGGLGKKEVIWKN